MILLFTILFLSACSPQHPSQSTAQANELIGSWEGGNPNRSCGAMWWTITRDTHNYQITFYSDKERRNPQGLEQGKWWLKDNYYYAIAPEYMSEPDVYFVEKISNRELRFTSEEFDESGICKEKYQFTDTKV